MWAVFALLSAVFAALTSILAKLGMGELNSNLAHRHSYSGGAHYGMGYRIYDRKTS